MERKLIVHKVHGLCEVIDTVELNETLYYKIKALNEDSLILYCPIDKKNDLYRPLLTKEEIYDVLNYMKSINDVEFDFSKQRRTRFKELLYSGNIKNIGLVTQQIPAKIKLVSMKLFHDDQVNLITVGKDIDPMRVFDLS